MNRFLLFIFSIILSSTIYVNGRQSPLEGKIQIAHYTSFGLDQDILTETDEDGIKYIILQCRGAVETGIKTSKYDFKSTHMSLYGFQIYSLIRSLEEAKDKFPSWLKLAITRDLTEVGIPICLGTSANLIEWADSIGEIEYAAGDINVGCYFQYWKSDDCPATILLEASTGYTTLSDVTCSAQIRLTFNEIQPLINILRKLCRDMAIEDDPIDKLFR